MLCCKFNLPGVFGWRIKGIGKCTELICELRKVMCLIEVTDEMAEVTVMPRSYYDSLHENERSGLKIFYSRKAVRLFYDKYLDKWLLVVPEDVLSDRKTRIVLIWLALNPFYLHCFFNGGLPVHAASAVLKRNGIIIAASGDTGKTTTVRRLPSPWQELGDDAALLLPADNRFLLFPLPTWSDFIHGGNLSASWKIEKGTNLAGIFFLKQSNKDGVKRLPPPNAAISLYQSSMEAATGIKKDISKKLNAKIFNTVTNIVAKVPVFSLDATLNGKVWESIENGLTLNEVRRS